MPRVDVRRANVTACVRCKSRKQRCDQKIPACSNCERAGVECVGFDTVTGRVAPRSYLQSLEDRVAVLETMLQAHGIPVDDSPIPSSSSPARTPANLLPGSAGESQYPSSQLSSENERILGLAAFSTLSATSFPRYVGSGSGLQLIRLLLRGIGSDISFIQGSTTNDLDTHGLVAQILPTTALRQLPEYETARSLTTVYFEHCDYFLPCLDQNLFLISLKKMYDQPYNGGIPLGLEHEYFKCFMVMATGVLLLAKIDASTSYHISDRLMASAIKILEDRPSAILTGDLDHMEAVLLLTQYSSLHPKSTGSWHMTGLACRLAIDLGLHEEFQANQTLDPPSLDRRRKLFWAAYSLEVNICTVLGRPIGIPDEAITADYPLAVDDDYITKEGILPHTGVSRKATAIWIIKERRLEAEIQARLHQAPPRGYPPLNYHDWRSNMAQRLQSLYDDRPPVIQPSQLAPPDVFKGFYSTAMVHLYAPSRNLPSLTLEDAIILTQNILVTVELYNHAFRARTLRFYWRTIHKLFHCGMALLYCIINCPQITTKFDMKDLTLTINTCSSVLWGMVERYPAGKACRDLFDQIASQILDPGRSNNNNDPNAVDLDSSQFVQFVSTPPTASSLTAFQATKSFPLDSNTALMSTDWLAQSRPTAEPDDPAADMDRLQTFLSASTGSHGLEDIETMF